MDQRPEHKSSFHLTPVEKMLINNGKEKFINKQGNIVGMIGTYQGTVPVVWRIGYFRADKNKKDPKPVVLSTYAEKCYKDLMGKWQ
jgi:hypothetical protein